jgi:hypothetical protein
VSHQQSFISFSLLALSTNSEPLAECPKELKKWL